jgi:hypothetical protein
VTAGLLEAPSRALAGAFQPAPPGGGRTTLEERLQTAWRLLQAEGAANCPVCSGEMTLRAGVGACAGCGARLR